MVMFVRSSPEIQLKTSQNFTETLKTQKSKKSQDHSQLTDKEIKSSVIDNTQDDPDQNTKKEKKKKRFQKELLNKPSCLKAT